MAMIKSVYLAGPMESAGGNFNFPLFDYVAERLRGFGFDVFSPAEHARRKLGSLQQIQQLEKAQLRQARHMLLREELNWIFVYADAVVLLPGWQRSGGASLERQLALYLGLKIHEITQVILPNGNPDSLDFSLLKQEIKAQD